MEKNNSRRQFLRNTLLTSAGVAILPTLAKTEVEQNEDTQTCDPVTLDYYGQGPFYTAGAPVFTSNVIASSLEPGTRLIISGVVRNLDCTKLLNDTELDIWHANDAGQYDNVGYNLRGKIYANAAGFYTFETILPGKYLNGGTYRPRHIHVKIKPPGFPTLTTQLYFEGDTSIPTDAAASITSGTYDATHRIIPITLNGLGEYEGTWDIVINGDGIITNSQEDLHIDKGIIYSASPNPFQNKVTIQYGLFRAASVSIEVFDMLGNLVAELDKKDLSPEKYEAVWAPNSNIQPGIYWVSLKVNSMQVHYLKIFKI